ncbi:NTP transferase domain-containing protein [Myceligenerans indicum]|uniref:NTP transferase domain-containing protein n=1 Tax=Myceligenerans indicum TaxID=2593663 RepID=UPI0027DD2389|nr:NTP transferase domain-containing protein [Myceligenerans indicum]
MKDIESVQDVACYDTVVLAGGRASRLDGTAKPGLLSGGGVPLLHLALDAAAGARRIAVVGPADLAEAIAAHPAASRSVLTREDPPFGGPVAAIAAGLAALAPPARRAPADPPPPWVLVLAVDVPRAAGAVPRLRAAVEREPEADGAHLVAGGRAQWLVGLYRTDALGERLSALHAGRAEPPAGRGASVRRLLDGLRLLEVQDPGSLSADVDTWDDAERLGVRPGPPPKE